MDLKYEHLLGRPWIANKQDCFSMTIDFFKDNFDIDIPNFARPTNWNADKLDLIRMLMPKSGFDMVHDEWRDLRPCDVLACSFGSANPNHFVIYLGDNQLLHHKYGVNSNTEVLRPAYRMNTGFILRHPDVPDIRPVLPDATIEDIIRARFQVQAPTPTT